MECRVQRTSANGEKTPEVANVKGRTYSSRVRGRKWANRSDFFSRSCYLVVLAYPFLHLSCSVKKRSKEAEEESENFEEEELRRLGKKLDCRRVMEVKGGAATTTERPTRWWNYNGQLPRLKEGHRRKGPTVDLFAVGEHANYELLESLLQSRELEEVKIENLQQDMERRFQPKKLVQSVNVVRKSRSTQCRKAESKDPAGGSVRTE
nr:unnamed protein product [Haemonchus contortus]